MYTALVPDSFFFREDLLIIMELIEHFGIDPILIAAQIVNFLIIFYVLKRFLYKPLFKTFKKREALIKESIEKAEEARKALEQAQKEEKDVIRKAQVTAKQIIADAKEQSETLIKNAEEAAKKQSQQIIADAKETIERETKQAEQRLSQHVSKLAVDMLEKSLTNVFTEKEQSEIVSKAVKSLDKKVN